MSEYSESLLEAIDIVARARDAELPYDQTLECVVIDNSEAQSYKYLVSNNGGQFVARTERTDLQIGDHVYVKIVNNDPAAERLIISKKMMEQESIPVGLEYEKFVKVTQNFAYQYSSITSIDGNSDTREIVLSNTINEESVWAGYTTMGLKFSLSAMPLNVLDKIINGNYGVKVVLYCLDQTTSSSLESVVLGLEGNKKEQWETKEFSLDCVDMIGVDHYNTLGYCNQSKLYDITNLIIKRVEVWLYQKGNFRDNENNSINPEEKTFRISVDSLSIAFGYDIAQFTNHYLLYLYTQGGLRYNDSTASRKMYVRYLDDNGVEYSTDDSLRLFKYDPSRPTINEQLNEWYYENVEAGGLGETAGNLQTLAATVTTENQKFKACIYRRGSYLKSNEIIFVNSKYNANSETLDLITGLQIGFGNSENNGVYQIYGQDNLLLNQGEANKLHYLQIRYSASSGRTLQPDDIISWKIPKENTMIDAPRGGEGGIQANEIDERPTYYYVTHQILSSELSEEDPAYALPFRIKDFYSSQNTKNTIEIEYSFIHDGVESKIETSQQLLFGFSGSQGADYIFTLTLNDKNGYRIPALTKGQSGAVCVRPSLYDYNQREITDFGEVRYSWLYGVNNCLTVDDEMYFSFLEGYTLESATKNILVGEIEYQGTQLRTYLPIPIRDETVSRMDGASTVTYEITGKKPQYYKAQYKLSGFFTSSVYWYSLKDDDKIGYPELDSASLCLMPSSIYQNNLGAYTVYATKKKDSTDLADILWIQPILITQNRYPSAMWNSESNELTFKNSNNKIEMTMVGRVNTDNNNDLNGLFMGILKEGNSPSAFGLYGYSDDKQIFCLDESGKLALGNMSYEGNRFVVSGEIAATRFDGLASSARDYEAGGAIAQNFASLVAENNSLRNTINNLITQVNNLEARLAAVERT